MKKILLATPTMHTEEQQYIQKAFETNWISPLGPNVDEFENKVAAYVGVSSSAALSSGTAALHLSLILAGVQENDIVFVPSLTFAASVNPVRYEKATPVFIDSERDTWNMDAAALRKAFEKYPHPKAVMAVHLYGTSANMNEICALCKEHNVPLIEDGAESLGTTYKGKMTGTFGDYGIYFFNGNKIITTSGGAYWLPNRKKMWIKPGFYQDRLVILPDIISILRLVTITGCRMLLQESDAGRCSILKIIYRRNTKFIKRIKKPFRI